jgi:hypothetical protein
MLLFVTGASGSGKTTIMPGLEKKFPEYSIHDFDERGVPDDADTRWRQEQTEYWINKGIENQNLGQDTIICGGAVYGEILACPSIRQIEGLGVCLLDCSDVERIRRIRSRGEECTMDMLSWSAWLRVHAVDPEWYPQVIRQQGYDLMNWENWQAWNTGDKRWQVAIIDTSGKKIPQIINLVSKWVDAQMSSNLVLNLDRRDEDDLTPEDRR